MESPRVSISERKWLIGSTEECRDTFAEGYYYDVGTTKSKPARRIYERSSSRARGDSSKILQESSTGNACHCASRYSSRHHSILDGRPLKALSFFQEALSSVWSHLQDQASLLDLVQLIALLKNMHIRLASIGPVVAICL